MGFKWIIYLFTCRRSNSNLFFHQCCSALVSRVLSISSVYDKSPNEPAADTFFFRFLSFFFFEPKVFSILEHGNFARKEKNCNCFKTWWSHWPSVRDEEFHLYYVDLSFCHDALATDNTWYLERIFKTRNWATNKEELTREISHTYHKKCKRLFRLLYMLPVEKGKSSSFIILGMLETNVFLFSVGSHTFTYLP